MLIAGPCSDIRTSMSTLKHSTLSALNRCAELQMLVLFQMRYSVVHLTEMTSAVRPRHPPNTRESIGVMRNILPHSAKQVSSHPVQVRCTTLTLFYLLIRTSRPSPGLQSKCPRRVALSRTHASFYRCFKKKIVFINPHFQTITVASE